MLSLFSYKPPRRPGEILLRRAGFTDISPGRQERQGRSFPLPGRGKGKGLAFQPWQSPFRQSVFVPDMWKQ
jgi:hypothetical protein